MSWNAESTITRNHLGLQNLAQHRFPLTPVIAVTWNHFWTPKYRYILDKKFRRTFICKILCCDVENNAVK
jgi:acetylglutamate synthase